MGYRVSGTPANTIDSVHLSLLLPSLLGRIHFGSRPAIPKPFRGTHLSDQVSLGFTGLTRLIPPAYMHGSCVPRGSVGRVWVVRGRKQEGVYDSAEKAELLVCSTIRCGALQPAASSAGAATVVGAPLSAKDRRTYWEVCLEGKQVRE